MVEIKRTTLAMFSCAMMYLMGTNHAASGLVLGRGGGSTGRLPVLTTSATTSWARSQISRGDAVEGTTKAVGKYPFQYESDYPESAIPPPAAHTRLLPGAGESGFKAGTVGPRRVLHSAAGPSGAFNRPTTVGMIFSLQAPKPPTL